MKNGLYIATLAFVLGSSSVAGADAKRLALKGAPITFEAPAGLEDTTSDMNPIPPMPVVHFGLPKDSNNGRPGYPLLILSRISDYEGSDMSAYIDRQMPTDPQEVIVTPHPVTIDGRPGYEFAREETFIADFEGGKSATGHVAKYEIVFQDSEALYHCYLELAPDMTKKYLPTFESFCKSVKFSR